MRPKRKAVAWRKRMADNSEWGDDTDDLRGLGDPEFITRWAQLRQCLFYIAREEPMYPEVKRRYDALAVEYRRRMGGGLSVTTFHH